MSVSRIPVKQLAFELKNVKELEPEHVNQLYRYLDSDFGRLGILVSRKEPPRAVRTAAPSQHITGSQNESLRLDALISHKRQTYVNYELRSQGVEPPTNSCFSRSLTISSMVSTISRQR
jgi:hypothetical protein